MTLNAGTTYVIGAKIFLTGTGSYTLTVRPSGGDTVQEFTYDRYGNRTKLTETKNGNTWNNRTNSINSKKAKRIPINPLRRKK